MSGVTRKSAIGKRFGRLTVLADVSDSGKNRRVLVRCSCFVEKTIFLSGLISGRVVSCGCFQREKAVRHGMSYTRTYTAWANMKRRCENPKDRAFDNYGERGIFVCSRWSESFENFLADMGECPPVLTLDRVDNDKGYTLGNCRWATVLEQNRNMRSVRLDLVSASQIRWLVIEGGHTRAVVAKAFGIHHMHCGLVVRGGIWKESP
jgi:hypothetical protein